MKCLVQGENTLSCYSIVNKIIIIRVISHLPHCSPILAHIYGLHFDLALKFVASVYSDTRQLFCHISFLSLSHYLLSPNCASSIILTLFYNSALFLRLYLAFLCEALEIHCLCKYSPPTNSYPAPHKYFKVLAHHTENAANDHTRHLDEHCSL
jgi:hypothetical protein